MTARVNELGQPIGPDVPGWSPRDRPHPDILQGSSVRLERLAASHVPGLHASICAPGTDPAWTYMSQGPFADEASLTAYLEPMWSCADRAPLAIVSAIRGHLAQRSGLQGPVP